EGTAAGIEGGEGRGVAKSSGGAANEAEVARGPDGAARVAEEAACGSDRESCAGRRF
ncbi:MAG: hypothetical protein H6Q78_1004, partial [Candidatus Krumholzibacteriota bacterium]|nr:hypothetical protein [Candidatus Krumholzibacteriota bacterium]